MAVAAGAVALGDQRLPAFAGGSVVLGGDFWNVPAGGLVEFFCAFIQHITGRGLLLLRSIVFVEIASPAFGAPCVGGFGGQGVGFPLQLLSAHDAAANPEALLAGGGRFRNLPLAGLAVAYRNRLFQLVAAEGADVGPLPFRLAGRLFCGFPLGAQRAVAQRLALFFAAEGRRPPAPGRSPASIGGPAVPLPRRRSGGRF